MRPTPTSEGRTQPTGLFSHIPTTIDPKVSRNREAMRLTPTSEGRAHATELFPLWNGANSIFLRDPVKSLIQKKLFVAILISVGAQMRPGGL